MDYTTESQIKQVGYSENFGFQEKLLVPSGLLGFHNTETIIEKAKSGRDVFVLLGEVSQHPSDIVCPKCGCKMHIHGSYPTCLRHLNFGGKLSCVSFNKSRYENYLDYIYSYYDRDYTPTDAEAFLADVRQYLVPVADALYARDPKLHLGYSDALDQVPVTLLGTAAEKMGGPVLEAYRFLAAYELYDLSPTPEKRDVSYMTYVAEYEAPIILINPLKHPDVYDTLYHEFGHFVDSYVHCGSYDDLETAETFSQAMVYLALANSALPENVKAKALRMALTELLLERIIERSTYADFEQRVYTMDPAELSLEKLDAIYEQCCLDDGHRVPYPEGVRPLRWVRDDFFFDSPGYVISYPCSAVASLQICQKEAEKPSDGVAAFCRLLNYADGWYSFQYALPAAGLKNPFAQKNKTNPLVEIAAFLKEALELP